MRINELEYCLSMLPEKARREIAARLDLNRKGILAELKQKLSDPDYYTAILSEVDDCERIWLWSILFESVSGKISKQELYHSQNPALSPPVFRKLMEKACRNGWVYGLRNRQLELVYYCPKEVRAGWAKAMLREHPQSPLDEDAVTPVIANPLLIGQAFFHLLSSLSHKPWLLTRTGTIPQKELKKMDVELELLDIDFSWSGWTEFLLDVARSLRLVIETEKYAKVMKTGWMNWLRQSWEDSMALLYEAVCHTLLKDYPRLEGYRLLLEQLPTGHWFGMERICRQVQISLGGRNCPETVEQLRDHWLIPMACMGWLESGKTKEGEICLKWLACPPREWDNPGEIPVYLEPELEILVPYHFPWKKRYELSQWADFMGGDQILVYEINEHSLRRAFQYGWTLEKMTERLKKWTTRELPALFSDRLHELWKRLDAVYLSPWTYLKQTGKTESAWQERLSETDWEIKKCSQTEYFVNAPPTQVAAWLQEKGQKNVCIGKRWGFSDEKIKNEGWTVDFQGLSGCRVEYPDNERSSPAQSLPKAWFSGLRPYGLEMAREIVRQSIVHQLPLRLVQNGRMLEVCPQVLRYEQGEWVFEAASGQSRTKMRLNRIQALQLLPPSTSWD
ncbi:MAG: helicase-associated domain-containing protein [Thermoactinomyces sp.]